MQRILLLAVFLVPLIAADPSPQQPSEDDWWLPAWATPRPEVMGFYGPNPDDVPVADQPLALVTFRWKDVNPSEGVYDWSLLREALAGERPVYLRLENSHVIHCPDWLAGKYPELAGMILQGDSPQQDNWEVETGGTFYPMWHAGFRTEFRRLLADFRAQGFGSHERFRFWYIPGAWAWGEFGVDFVDEMAATGVTPDDYLTWWRETLDAYVDAVGREQAHKLMYTGHDHLELCESSDSARQLHWRNAIGRSLFTEVLERGGSTRWGLLEKFNFLAGDLPNYGLPAVEIGGRFYQVADESSPLLADPRRLIGSENEEVANHNVPWENYYQLKMTALRSLQLRVNRVFTNRDLWAKAQPLHQYMLRTLDRRPGDSPDAWCALRRGRDVYQEWSRYHLGWRGPWYLDNWERWLWQREVEPDGRSVLTTPVDVPVLFNEDNWEARRTDHATGSDYLYFWVEDRFLRGGSHRVQVKVTYLDDRAAEWWLEYDAADGNPRKRTASRINQADGAWRTVTFDLPDASFQGRVWEGSDFRIFNGGQRDLTVRFVRVIRLDEPTVTPSPPPGGDDGGDGGDGGSGGAPAAGDRNRSDEEKSRGCGAGSALGLIAVLLGVGWWGLSTRRR